MQYELLGQTHAEHQKKLRRESLVGMATRSWDRRNFPPSARPELWPTPSPVQLAVDLFLGGKTVGAWSRNYQMP